MRILFLLFVFAFCSCRATKPILVENHSRDSVFVTETIRDTTVIVAPDSAVVRALVECDSLGQAHLKELVELKNGKRIAPPKLALQNNILSATAKVDSMAISLQLKDRYKERTHEVVKTVTVEVNKLTTMQRFWIKSGKASALCVALLIGIAILKRWMQRR